MNLSKIQCRKCGAMSSTQAKYCSMCGNSLVTSCSRPWDGLISSLKNSSKRCLDQVRSKFARFGFYRDTRQKAIAGVCAGIANKLNVNLVCLRCVIVSLMLLGGFVGVLYVLCWLITEER